MISVIIDGYVTHITHHTFVIYADHDYYVVRSNKNYQLNEHVQIVGTLKSRIVGDVVTYEIIEA